MSIQRVGQARRVGQRVVQAAPARASASGTAGRGERWPGSSGQALVGLVGASARRARRGKRSSGSSGQALGGLVAVSARRARRGKRSSGSSGQRVGQARRVGAARGARGVAPACCSGSASGERVEAVGRILCRQQDQNRDSHVVGRFAEVSVSHNDYNVNVNVMDYARMSGQKVTHVRGSLFWGGIWCPSCGSLCCGSLLGHFYCTHLWVTLF